MKQKTIPKVKTLVEKYFFVKKTSRFFKITLCLYTFSEMTLQCDA